jgi:hypothetical protein
MYEIVEWNKNLDLSEFYSLAAKKGFANNSSQKMLVDCFRTEKDWNVWILYKEKKAIGSVAAHSFENIMGENTYRIAARTCILTDISDKNTLRTKNQIVTHQHYTSQFLIPACLSWVPNDAFVYITTNRLEAGTQRLVNKIFAPAMEKTGQMSYIKDVEYRGCVQSVWQFYPDRFWHEMSKYPRWN